MPHAKGLDDLFLAGRSPRFRRWYPVPAAVRQRRAVRDLAEPGHVSGGGTLQEARTSAVAAIEEFVSGLRRNAGRALLVRAAPGTGKSTALAASVQRNRVDARIVVGTKLLAREQAGRYGYNLIEGRNRDNCQRYDVVRALGEAGHPVEALACGTAFEPRCPFYQGCPYFAQYAQMGPRVAPAEQLFNRLFWKGGTLAVADDADLTRALIERLHLDQAVLERADTQLDALGYEVERAVLLVVCHALIDAPKGWLLAGHAWDLLAGVAARYGFDFADLIEALPKREALPQPFDDADGYVSVRTVEAVPPASVTVLLAALREELDAFRLGEDFNSRIRIRKGMVEVGRLRDHISDREGIVIARLPLLVLDATPLRTLVDHITAMHERLPDVVADIALPANVTVVQYATGTNGYTSLRSDAQVARVLDEIAQERLASPCAPGEEALIVYKDTLARFASANFAQDRILTFGSARGTNALAAVRRLHVVGRPYPPLEETFFLAQIIHHEEVAVSPEIVLRSREMGAQRVAVDVADYADPRMAVLLQSAREDELFQVLHRARLLTVDPQSSMEAAVRSFVRLVLHTSHPVPGGRVDELILSTNDEGWNEGLQLEAEKRISAAIARLRAAGLAVTVDAIVLEAQASKRTVRKYMGTRDHTPVDARWNPVGVPRTMGTKDHTSLKDSLRGMTFVPHAQTEISHGLSDARDHWEPCRGGCGPLMPPGQKCFDCAVRAVAEWKATNKKGKIAS